MAAGDVRGECERPEADGVAVLEPVVDPHGRVPDDPDPGKGSERQDRVGVVATGGEGLGWLALTNLNQLQVDRLFAIIVAFFAYLATRVVARYGFLRAGDTD